MGVIEKIRADATGVEAGRSDPTITGVGVWKSDLTIVGVGVRTLVPTIKGVGAGVGTNDPAIRVEPEALVDPAKILSPIVIRGKKD